MWQYQRWHGKFHVMENHWVLSLGLLAGVTAASCNGSHSFVQATIVGLPCAAPGQELEVPLVISNVHASGKGLQLYKGGMARPESMTIEKGKKQLLKVRLALCPDGQIKSCAERNEWLGAEQLIEADGTVANPSVMLAVVGSHPCKNTP